MIIDHKTCSLLLVTLTAGLPPLTALSTDLQLAEPVALLLGEKRRHLIRQAVLVKPVAAREHVQRPGEQLVPTYLTRVRRLPTHDTRTEAG